MEITGSIKRVREQVREWRKEGLTAVSYTHLTLPTKLEV